MVQWQLCTLDHLMNSGFGRPFPRHGLQLLFWFANDCVICELNNFVVLMKLVSDCQPERGYYGFHLFGNVEEILPVLNRQRRRNSKKQVVYYEVGNLNTETYPGSANLPVYVRENYGVVGNRSNNNIDRIIISYQVRTRVVETVYVTEHDGAAFGRFSPNRTYEISSELIHAMQSQQLDLTTFLTQMGYYGDIQQIYYPEPSTQQMLNTVQTYIGSTARIQQSDDFRFFSEVFNQQLNMNTVPFSYDQQVHYTVSAASYNSGLVANYREVPQKYRRPRASYWLSGWEQPYEGFSEKPKKRNGGGGGFSFVKMLLCVGALCLAAKCFSWLRSWWMVNEEVYNAMENSLNTHVMLDYVY